jgi:hypothetical protein
MTHEFLQFASLFAFCCARHRRETRVPGRTPDALPEPAPFTLRDSHPLWSAVPGRFGYSAGCSLGHGPAGPSAGSAPPPGIGLPPTEPGGFGLVPGRSPLLGESAGHRTRRSPALLSVPRGSEMFQFPRFPPPDLCVQSGVVWHHPDGVAPFGHPRISALARSPRRFVGLPRPSSASIAQASTARPFLLGPCPGPPVHSGSLCVVCGPGMAGNRCA